MRLIPLPEYRAMLFSFRSAPDISLKLSVKVRCAACVGLLDALHAYVHGTDAWLLRGASSGVHAHLLLQCWVGMLEP